MGISQMLFNTLMGFPRAQSWSHSFLPFIQPLLVQSYLNSMLPIIYIQITDKFTWILTLGTLILVPVQAWMGNNKLKLNSNKTEFIVIGDDQIRSSMKSTFPLSFLGNIMKPAESVKNLGVILDADNSIQRHVANLCCTCYFHLREP